MATTWDPAFKASTLTLSGSNLTATGSGSSVLQVVRSTTSQSIGKVYWEVTVGAMTANVMVGFGNPSVTTSTNLSSTVNSVCLVPGNNQKTLLNGVTLNIGSTSSVSGAVVSIALDVPNKLVWISDAVMRAASTPWNNSATANPNTNTGGQALTALAAGPYYAMFLAYETGGAATANFGATAFNQTVPTGFTAWDPPSALTSTTAIASVTTATLTGGGALSSTAAIATTTTATLRGAGALVSTAAIATASAATLTSPAALVGTAAITTTTTATLAGFAALVSTSPIVCGGVGVLTGKGALTSTAAIASGATATLISVLPGTMSSTAVIMLTASGVLTGAQAPFLTRMD